MLAPRLDVTSTTDGDTDQHSQSNQSGGSETGRRVGPWLLFATLVALTSLGAFRSRQAQADNAAPNAASVNSPDGLNLRSGPGTSFDVVAVMPAGAAVTITGAASGDNWLPVQFNGQEGWADGVYLSIGAAAAPTASASPAPTPPPAPAPTTAVVQPADGLNLRSGPGTSNASMTVIPGGTTVTVTGAASDGWVPVTFNGQSGWVNGSYLGSTAASSSASLTVNAGSSSGGAALSAPPAAATPAASPTSSAAPAAKLAWPGPSRRISTVFSPSHLGIDIDEFPASGRPLSASADGTVSFAGGDACCSYGLYVIVDHGNGLQTLYAHLTTIAVKVGQVVKQGQNLGVSGCTGKCTGPHIHYEVRVNGKQVDPLRYLPAPWDIE